MFVVKDEAAWAEALQRSRVIMATYKYRQLSVHYVGITSVFLNNGIY